MDPTLAKLSAISVIVIAAILVLILILLIVVLLQVRRAARETEKLIDSIRLQMAPVSCDLGLIVGDVKSIVQSVHRQLVVVEDGIETVHDMALRANAFQIGIQHRIEEHLFQIAAVFIGVKRGVEAVARFLGR